MQLYVCLAILLLCSGVRLGDAASQKELHLRDLKDDNTFVPMMYAAPTRIVFDNHGPSLTLSFLRRPDIFSFFGQYVEISEIELISEGLAPSFIPEYNVLQRFPLPSTEGVWNTTYWNTTEDVYDPNKNVSSYNQLVQWAKFTTTIANGAAVSVIYSLFSNTTKGTFPGSTNERTMPRGALHVEIKLSSWPFPVIENTTSNSSYPRFPMASVYTKIIGASFLCFSFLRSYSKWPQNDEYLHGVVSSVKWISCSRRRSASTAQSWINNTNRNVSYWTSRNSHRATIQSVSQVWDLVTSNWVRATQATV